MYPCIVLTPSYQSCLQQILSHNEDCRFAYMLVLFSISAPLCISFLSGRLQGSSSTASVCHSHLDEQQRLPAAPSLAGKAWESAVCSPLSLSQPPQSGGLCFLTSDHCQSSRILVGLPTTTQYFSGANQQQRLKTKKKRVSEMRVGFSFINIYE